MHIMYTTTGNCGQKKMVPDITVLQKIPYPAFQQIIDMLPACMWFKAADMNIVAANNAFADLLGIGKQEIMTRPARELFPETDVEIYLQDDMERSAPANPKSTSLKRSGPTGA